MHDEYDKTFTWTWNKTLGSIWKRHNTDTFLWVIALAPNCWSVVVDKSSDRNGGYCVCTVLPWATADGDAQREVQVKDNLFACPSISSFLIRIVVKSTAGGRLYDHHSPTSPNSLVLHSLVQKPYGVVVTDSHLRCVSNGRLLLSHDSVASAVLIVSGMKGNICLNWSCGIFLVPVTTKGALQN